MGFLGFGKKSPEPGSGEQDPTQFTMPANAEQANESAEASPEINLVPSTEESGAPAGAASEVITDKNDPNYDAFAALNAARQASAAEQSAITEERKAGLDVLASEEPSLNEIVKPTDSDEVHAVGAQVMTGQIPQADEASMREALSEVEKLGVTGDEVVIDKAAAIETTGVLKESAEDSAADESPIEPMSSEADSERVA